MEFLLVVATCYISLNYCDLQYEDKIKSTKACEMLGKQQVEDYKSKENIFADYMCLYQVDDW